VLLRALGLGVTGAARVRAESDAAILAESALDPLGIIAPLKDGDSAELDSGPYRVRVAVQRYGEGATTRAAQAYLVLYHLSATVVWREGRRERSLTLTTLRLGPNG
jgi:hypothetical protein